MYILGLIGLLLNTNELVLPHRGILISYKVNFPAEVSVLERTQPSPAQLHFQFHNTEVYYEQVQVEHLPFVRNVCISYNLVNY